MDTSYELPEADDLHQALLGLSQDTSAGQRCCENIVARLGQMLGMRYAFVGLIDDQKAGAVLTLAIALDGDLAPEYAYDLLGTPYVDMVGSGLCVYPHGVCQAFPQDQLLREMNASSFVGAPIFDTEGKRIGILVLLDEKPLADSAQLRSLVMMYAIRAGLEISRMRHEQQLRTLSNSVEEEVMRRTSVLEQANRRLECYACSISHDFRAPLRQIMGCCRMMSDLDGVRLDPAVGRYVESIMAACTKMASMMESLLEYARHSDAQPKYEWVDLAEVLQETVAQLSQDAPPALRINMGATGSIWADPCLIQIVFLNLIGNAIKYSSKQSGPVVSISSASFPDHDEITIEDNGVGFDMRYAGRLFDAFQRLHSERDFPGHGLGLANSMGIVRGHGGEIRYHSSPGAGAQFTLVLPRP